MNILFALLHFPCAWALYHVGVKCFGRSMIQFQPYWKTIVWAVLAAHCFSFALVLILFGIDKVFRIIV